MSEEKAFEQGPVRGRNMDVRFAPFTGTIDQKVEEDVTEIQGDALATEAVRANYRPVDLYRIARPDTPIMHIAAAATAFFVTSIGTYYLLNRYTHAPRAAIVALGFGAGLVASIVATSLTHDSPDTH